MSIWVTGISHKTCPIHLRERLFLRPAERQLLLARLRHNPAVIEAMVLSTCNRTEIYAHLLDEDAECLRQALFNIKQQEQLEHFRPYFFTHSGQDAVRHLFSVSSGLESLVIGEKQILGQVKEAVTLAREQGMVGKLFNVATNLAIRAGKKSQHETDISIGGSSVSWAAVTRAQQILGGLAERSVLIIGSGKMGKLAANQLNGRGFKQMYFMNRTLERARELAARFDGKASPFWNIAEVLADVDVCLCSVGAPHYVVEPSLIEKVMIQRQNRPLLLMDISIPRNIDPAVGRIPGVTLLSIDDLENVVAQNVERRRQAVTQVERIVEDKVAELERKIWRMKDFGTAPANVAAVSMKGLSYAAG